MPPIAISIFVEASATNLVVDLHGDLGTGETTLARGVPRGLVFSMEDARVLVPVLRDVRSRAAA